MQADQDDGATSTFALIATMAKLIDDRQFDEIGSLVTDDIIYASPAGEVRGWSAMRQGLSALKFFDSTFHFLSNHTGQWDGDDFHGSTYCIASHIYAGDEGERKYDMGIVYSDHIVWMDGALRLKHRVLQTRWQQDLPSVKQSPPQFREAIAKLMASAPKG